MMDFTVEKASVMQPVATVTVDVSKGTLNKIFDEFLVFRMLLVASQFLISQPGVD